MQRQPPATPQFAIAAIVLLTMLALIAQLKTERGIRTALGVGSPQLQALGIRLRKTEATREALEREVGSLRAQVAALSRVAAEEGAGLDAAEAELQRLRTLAGLTALTGPGVVVEIRDNLTPLGPGEDPNDVLVHYTDLYAIVRDLFAAGAEALAINGERFTVTSSLQCVGTTVLLNAKRVVAPFRVTAIGDARSLEGYLTRRGGTVEFLRVLGFPITISSAAAVAVPAYAGTFR